MGDLSDYLLAMRMPRAFRSCYNCANRYGCGVVGAPPVPLMMDKGQQCGFWRPQEGLHIPSETELAGMRLTQDEKERVAMTDRTVKNCNNCEHINLTEQQQHETAPGKPHICMKYGKRVFHR